MPKKTKISTDEMSAFLDAVKGVRRLAHSKVALKPADSSKMIKQQPSAHEDLKLDNTLDVPKVASEEALAYKQSSISNIILRKLRKGQYNIDAILDLHGMTIDQAKDAMVQFLSSCLQQECRVVLVIHGKGTHGHSPVLKNSVNKWLRQLDVVLAFCSAMTPDGGRGAAYVLLKHIEEK